MQHSRKAQELAQARPPVLSLESSEHVPRVNGCHHPKSSLALYLQHIRSSDQVAIAKPPILVFSLVAKHHTDACARSDGNSAKIRSDRYVEALLLSFYNSLEIKICMAFSVKININSVEHLCAPMGSAYGDISNFARDQKRWYRGGFLVNFRLVESWFREKLAGSSVVTGFENLGGVSCGKQPHCPPRSG